VPRGGPRPGAGRKPLERPLAALHGHRRRVLVEERSAVSPALPAPVPVDPPLDLKGAPLLVWQELAPFALAERTLTPATAAAFALLCRVIVLERAAGRSRDRGKADHRGLIIRTEAGLAKFRLSPTGKPNPPEKPLDPFAEFDGADGQPQ
jgi:hypothetical protein